MEYFLHPREKIFQPDSRRHIHGPGTNHPERRNTTPALKITSEQLDVIRDSLNRSRKLYDNLRVKAFWVRTVIFALSLIALVVYLGLGSATHSGQGSEQSPSDFVLKTELLIFAGQITVGQVSAIAPLIFAFLFLYWARLSAAQATVEAEIALIDFVLRRFGAPTADQLGNSFRIFYKEHRSGNNLSEQLKDVIARGAHHAIHYCFDVFLLLIATLGAVGVAWRARSEYVAVMQTNKWLGLALYFSLGFSVLLPIIVLIATSVAKKKKKELLAKFCEHLDAHPEDILSSRIASPRTAPPPAPLRAAQS